MKVSETRDSKIKVEKFHLQISLFWNRKQQYNLTILWVIFLRKNFRRTEWITCLFDCSPVGWYLARPSGSPTSLPLSLFGTISLFLSFFLSISFSFYLVRRLWLLHSLKGRVGFPPYEEDSFFCNQNRFNWIPRQTLPSTFIPLTDYWLTSTSFIRNGFFTRPRSW